MIPTKPDLVILPFKATPPEAALPLTLEQTLSLLRSGVHVQIERSQPVRRMPSAGRSFAAHPGSICTKTNPSSASNAAHAATSEKLMPFITRYLVMMA